MKLYLLLKAMYFKLKYGISNLPCSVLAYLMSFPGTVYDIILDEEITLAGLKLIYKLREQIDHCIQTQIESEGLHGYGSLDIEIKIFLKKVISFQSEINDVLIGGDRLVYVLEHNYGYDFPDRYIPLLDSRGLKYCIIDNLLGNLMGYYGGNILDVDDFDYLFAVFEDLAEQGANYVLVPGDDRDARVQIREW